MNELQRTLSEMIKSGSQSNLTMNKIINDYAKYHAIMVIVCGCLVLIFAFLSIIFWTKFKRMPKIRKLKWKFEKKVYFSFGILTTMVALLMILLVVANASNALNALKGFSMGVNPSLSKVEIHTDELHHIFSEWIKLGDANIPPIIKQQINECARFHTIKAIYSGILFIIFVTLSIIIWTILIKKAKVNDSKWTFKEKTYFVFGNVTVVISLLMMVIVVANIQGAFAPLTAFLVGFLQ